MKILLTGCTPKQSHPQESFQYFSFFQALHDALKSRGHEVDWRGVIAGEDIDHYDRALVGLHVIGSNAARRWKYGAYWVMSRLPHIPIMQDWRVAKVFSSLRSQKFFWQSSHLGEAECKKYWEPAAKHRAWVERPRYVMEHKFPGVLLPMFPWGSPHCIQTHHRVDNVLTWNPDDWYDPSRWYVDFDFRTALPRRREWTCASLSDVSEWVNKKRLKWPVHRIWADQSTRGEGGSRIERWTPTPEPDVVRNHYQQEWGVLIPNYGSGCRMPGWWRGRYKLTGWSGAVALADAKDCSLPEFSNVDTGRELVEGHDDAGLAQISEMQYAAILRDSLSPAESALRLERLLLDECVEPLKPRGVK